MMRVVCVLSSPGCQDPLWNDRVESRHLLAWPKLHVMTESSKGLKNVLYGSLRLSLTDQGEGSRCLPRKKGLQMFCADRVLSSFKW